MRTLAARPLPVLVPLRRTACPAILAAAAILLAADRAVRAADTNVVPVARIVAATVAHSWSLQAAQEDVRAAAARERTAAGSRFPTLDASARAGRYSGLEDAALGPQVLIPAIEEQYGGTLVLSQPLYTGGRLRQRQREAHALTEAARAETAARCAGLVRSALEAYWTWFTAWHQARAVEAAVAWMQTHARDVRNRQENGTALESEQLAAEVRLEQYRLLQQDASRRTRIAEAVLASLTGAALPDGAVPQAPEPVAEPAASPATPLERAEAQRPELADARLRAEAADHRVRAVRAIVRPQVALQARYDQARPNPAFFPPSEEWQDDTFVGVTATWRLWDRDVTRGELEEARARQRQARDLVGQVRDQVALEVRVAQIDLEYARARQAVAAQAHHSAEKSLKAATDLWTEGMGQHADVLDARARLVDAEFEVLAAAADAAVADARLRHAEGSLKPAEAAAPEGGGVAREQPRGNP